MLDAEKVYVVMFILSRRKGRPCSYLGWLVLPTRTSGPKVPISPLAFDIRVFSLLRRVFPCACRWCGGRSYTGRTRAGERMPGGCHRCGGQGVTVK